MFAPNRDTNAGSGLLPGHGHIQELMTCPRASGCSPESALLVNLLTFLLGMDLILYHLWPLWAPCCFAGMLFSV